MIHVDTVFGIGGLNQNTDKTDVLIHGGPIYG